MTKVTLTLSAAVLAAMSTPSVAGDVTVRGSRTVEDGWIRVAYGDLQLAQANDADELRGRLRHAVRRGCGDLYGSAQVSQEWACRDIAAMAAAPQVEKAIADARSGRRIATANLVIRLARR